MATDWHGLIAGAPGHLLGFLHLGLATWVTVHVLLHKRDVPAAIGWIGLGWLSPLVGPTLYFMFGINRVERRATRLKPARRHGKGEIPAIAPKQAAPVVPQALAALARVAGRVSRLPLTGGNAVSILRGGAEAYPAMLASIDAARHTIALASYIFEADAAGSRFVVALAAARARGVQIRVLIDGVGGGYVYSGTAWRLRAAGVPTARFLHDWLPWQMPFLNLRSHKKLLIVDGAEGFTGGLNIAAENLLPPDGAGAVDDTHFRIRGPVLRHLMRSFASDWNFTTGEKLDGKVWWPIPPESGGTLARGIDSGPDEDLGAVETILAAALGEARTRIRIVTPYFLPSAPLMSAIGLAALRGAHVEILFPARSDHRVLDWAVRAHLGFFAAPGIAFYEGGPGFDHSKLVTIDHTWCLIGSPNWDARSLRLNFEFAVEAYDPDLVARIDAVIDEKLAKAKPLKARRIAARGRARRIRDAASRLLMPYL